ncbi:helix-turn-helix domain-containing protein [Streptosporangium saharense]|uniref:Transcriptional regulator with XRE-family HTH domain n=1 Tax=Streptosporangium saharense TaxID=1706840 RepID=A0A7W7QH54_9ACTN|nr:helix-turn-helix transcriptional regulator [Streptosporangium saharense]MBB4913507.1 transcriptional regulator with XRE-family HTH domain [Streptosporangium saharense]
MPAPKKLDPNPKTPLAALGLALRYYREAAGFTQEQLADRVSYSHSQIGQVERAGRRPARGLVERCDRVLGAEGELLKLYDATEAESTPSWFRSWVEVERVATSIRSWEPLVVPGLLQTEEYARAAIRGEPGLTEEAVESKLAVRMARQNVFLQETPPMLWAVLDECALIRPVGGKEVLRGQLEHLLETVESPYISVQVSPLELGSTTGMLGGFALATIPGARDTAYLESAGTGQVTDQPETVRYISIRYEAIRADALSRRESKRLIEEKIRKWT